jgi:hypothetical protein
MKLYKWVRNIHVSIKRETYLSASRSLAVRLTSGTEFTLPWGAAAAKDEHARMAVVAERSVLSMVKLESEFLENVEMVVESS